MNVVGLLKAQRLVNAIFVICLCCIPASAQYAISTVTGVVRSEDGRAVSSARISWVQQGRVRQFESDSAGKFVAYFVDPGIYTIRFEHASTASQGSYVGLVPTSSSLSLTVVLEEEDGSSGVRRWRIREELPGPSDVWKPERLLTRETIESFPSTEHLWTFLNQIEPSVVSDQFDSSGLHSVSPSLIGVRGSSWSQNFGWLNGVSVSSPAGTEMLNFPDLSAMETVVYSVGESPLHHNAPGAHLEMTPKYGERSMHGEARLFFQSGALQNTNVTPRDRTFDIFQPDERWKHFFWGGAQISGPIEKTPWSYFASISGRELKTWIRTQSLPVSGSVQQQTYNFIRSAAPNDRAAIHISLQHRNEPQLGASPQISRDSTVDQKQTHRSISGSWTHEFSPRRSLRMDFGVTRSRTSQRFQNGVIGQSVQDLFPGFVVDGITPLDYMLQGYGRLVNTSRGPAASITDSSIGAMEGSASYSIIGKSFWNSRHQITLGGILNRSTLSQSQQTIDGVNLLFFEGLPNSVRLVNNPSTRDRIADMQFYATDNFSLSRYSFLAELTSNASRFLNVLGSGGTVNANYWRNIGGRTGMGVQLFRRLVGRISYARIYDEPNLVAASTVNPEGSSSLLYTWKDLNGDRRFQPGENTQLLKVTGAPFTTLDGNLKNPSTSELTIGVSQTGLHGFHTEFFGYRRSLHNQISLANTGVPLTSYDPLQIIDPGLDAVLGSADDQPMTVFNQKPSTLGQDRYLLTNPVGYNAHSEGFEFTISLSSTNIQASTTVTRYRSVAENGPGLTATENDLSNLQGVFDDPNHAINARGSTFFDRGTMVRQWIALKLPAGVRAAAILNYQDGLPYARVLPVPLNQGVIGILTGQRGPGNSGTFGGMRTTHYQTIDVRLAKVFKFEKGRLTASLDVFNISNLALNLVQMAVTSHHAEWRVPLQFQSPRSIQPGLRYSW